MKKINRIRIPKTFYLEEDVVGIARELLGKSLVTAIEGSLTSGIITETEAYAGITDRASHAYNNTFTRRTEVMYREGGIAYVYLCYGIHSLFNIVTGPKGIPHAVLIRGILAEEGRDRMMDRTGKKIMDHKATDGPGKLSVAMGIHFSHSGMDLQGPEIWLEDRGLIVREGDVITGPRVGVDYAGEDALLPYRFRIDPGILVHSL